ncbi:MAG: rhamnan synthesis F family protein [Synechococcus sp.]
MSGRPFQPLPVELLDPKLLPHDLLTSPERWQPTMAGIDPSALLEAHPDLQDSNDVLSSGRLVEIALGKRSLYSDLPPIHLGAYLDGLRPAARRELQQHRLSALEHLAGPGWRRFRAGKALGKDLDRYQPRSPCESPPSASLQARVQALEPGVLVVLNPRCDGVLPSPEAPQRWQAVVEGGLETLDTIWQQLRTLQTNPLISFCHGSDRLDPSAVECLAAAGNDHPECSLITSDESLLWRSDPQQPPGNPQYRAAPTPWRLLSRGAIGGLVSIRLQTLLALELPKQRSCLHTLLIDLSLQLIAQRAATHHLPTTLLSRHQPSNPAVPDVASPQDRHAFNPEQAAELLAISQQRAEPLLVPGGSIHPHSRWRGCLQTRWNPATPPRVSILIPFRDKVELTQLCVESIQRCAGSIPYELVLIDNGSTEAATAHWLEQQSRQANVTVLRFDCPFNYARLHNLARPHCQGSHLLLLNNDIELHSPDLLQELLHPFALRNTVAVGARLLYPDGSIQHQGVALISGERRCVLEPGKHLHSEPVIDSFTALGVQEEWIAATAACLMLRAQDFDAVGGFDEDFAVVFNDVDLCLRLRQATEHGDGAVVVTPNVRIIHHESISRGKDQYGEALARHQRESGHLRRKHAALFASGDPLRSPNLHPHSSRFQPRETEVRSGGPVHERLIGQWSQRSWPSSANRPVILFAHYDHNGRLRPDLLPLLKSYQTYGDVVFVSASPRLRWRWRTMRQLRTMCRAILIRRNEGYDFGSWMTGLRWLQRQQRLGRELILTNDSFYGPVGDLDDLFQRIHTSDADVIGLTDDLMYAPHLQSAFLVFRAPVLQSDVFQSFWDTLQIWPRKRDLVKQCEVGLPVALQKAGFRLRSLYTEEANGNILHTAWRELIEDAGFPFVKVSLLRDNPTRQRLDGWEQVIGSRNPALAEQIRQQRH